jgi:SAM-dependent methyltransferase
MRRSNTRFRFGENWRSFVQTITPDNIHEAERGLLKLFPNDELRGATFLDVGCGSGLSMLAAARLGAREVRGTDIDADSVAASRQLLEHYSIPCTIEQNDVLQAPPLGTFQNVYAWGVLHHTGAMWTAISNCCALVAPNGRLALALYRRTPFCNFWRTEKYFYSNAPSMVQAIARTIYKSIYVLGLIATRRNPIAYIKNYRRARGMDWSHNVHDWLGGYPYESVSPEELEHFLTQKGFSIKRSFTKPAALGGLLGSHCDEFVAERVISGS